MIIDISTKIGTTSNQGGFKGLLDVYSGAAAAYSLRKLSKATTSVVRVRRDSDNAEADFTALEITDGTLEAFCTGTDGLVTTWYDQSGNGNDATQGSAASQPKIVDAGVLVTENGKPAVDFDGLDDYLLNGITANYTTYSEIVVAKNAGNSTFSALIAHNSGATSQQGYLGTRNSGADWGTFDSGQQIFGSVSGNLDLISRYKNVSNSISNYVNRILGDVYTSTQGTTPALIGVITQPILLGQYQGYVSEFIFYPTDQSTNRTGIEANINKHYNIYP